MQCFYVSARACKLSHLLDNEDVIFAKLLQQCVCKTDSYLSFKFISLEIHTGNSNPYLVMFT